MGIEPRINPFNAVAGHFFYPLMTKADRREKFFDPLVGRNINI
jgi:hypothetical protein